MKKSFTVCSVSLIILFGCSESNTELSIPVVVPEKLQCDSMFLIALELIQTDSFPFFDGNHYYGWDFTNYEFNDDSVIEAKTDIISAFHDSLSIDRIWSEFGIDTIFTKNEIQNYKEQELSITTECYPNYEFISYDSLERLFKWNESIDTNSSKRIEYFTFSKPLLSSDGKFLLMELNHYCGGLCGSGFTYLFILEGEEWKIARRIGRWVA